MPLPRKLQAYFLGEEERVDELSAAYREATESVRASARWLLTAFAAVGGALVAGVPLTDIGRVGVWSLRFWLAIAAVAVALLAIASMIWAVSRVFTSRYVSFGELALGDLPKKTGTEREGRLRQVVKAIDASRDELFGSQADTLPMLAKSLRQDNELVRSTPEHTRNLALETATTRVLDFANYEYTRRTFQELFPRLALAGAITALGVAAYAVAVTSAPSSAPAVTAPLPVTLTLNPQRQWNKLLGPRCDLKAVAAVAIAGPLSAPVVVTSPTPLCRAAQFKVGRRQGIAVPLVSRP